MTVVEKYFKSHDEDGTKQTIKAEAEAMSCAVYSCIYLFSHSSNIYSVLTMS